MESSKFEEANLIVIEYNIFDMWSIGSSSKYLVNYKNKGIMIFNLSLLKVCKSTIKYF